MTALLSTGGDEDFALVLFEEEGKYSVVEKERIKEKHYAYNQTVNVLWGKGKDAEHYPGKLVLCGKLMHVHNLHIYSFEKR